MKSDVSQTGLSHHLAIFRNFILLYSFDFLCIQIYLWHHLLVPTDILLEWIVDEIGRVPPIFHHGAMIDGSSGGFSSAVIQTVVTKWIC